MFEYPPRKVSFIVRLLQNMGPNLDPEGQDRSPSSGSSSLVAGVMEQLAAMSASAWAGWASSGLGGIAAAVTAADKVVEPLGEVASMAAELNGKVSCYSLDAHLMSKTIN